MIHFEPEVRKYATLQADADRVNFTPFRQHLLMLLHQAESDLRLRTTGPLSIGVEVGRVFEYFDELRKLIETAKSDLLMVDPYLDAEFVSRYLPFVAQSGLAIEVRAVGGFHDRHLFVDGQACYQSGASFKDGAKKTPTVLVQITDAFAGVNATYEQLWANAAPI